MRTEGCEVSRTLLDGPPRYAGPKLLPSAQITVAGSLAPPPMGANPLAIPPLGNTWNLLRCNKGRLDFLSSSAVEVKRHSTTRELPCVTYHNRSFNDSRDIEHFPKSKYPEPPPVPAAYGLQFGPRLCST